MRKTSLRILAVSLVLAFVLTGCGTKRSYNSVQEAMSAYSSGNDVSGKHMVIKTESNESTCKTLHNKGILYEGVVFCNSKKYTAKVICGSGLDWTCDTSYQVTITDVSENGTEYWIYARLEAISE